MRNFVLAVALIAVSVALGAPAYAQSWAPGLGYVFKAPVLLKFPPTVVASLPTCNLSRRGEVRTVTDAASPTFMGTATGSGTFTVPVVCSTQNSGATYAWMTF